MALVPGTLQAGILSALTTVQANPAATPVDVAALWASAYQSYAGLAQSVLGFPPSVVNYPGLQAKLLAAFAIHTDLASAASDLADAFMLYWTGALFGATGPVVVPGNKGLLVGLLVAAWTGNLAAGVTVTLPQVAQQMASALDAFTRTVMAGDSVLPIPTGTPPAPIM